MQLDATIPAEGMSNKTYLENKFGPETEDNTWTQMREYLIEAGTPLVHVIPFKREQTELQFDTWDEEQMIKDELLHMTKFHDNYRRLWWHKRKAK